MRTVLTALTLTFASTAFAGEPLTCEALEQSEATATVAFDNYKDARFVAWSKEYDIRIAIAEADERDELVRMRDEAKKQMGDLRKKSKTAKKAHKEMEQLADANGLQCTATSAG
ncbi:MAG: hypothetical protein EP330_09365 [Deltaproteobacteria bacterium]|nr:MAG: hypothetical protein EP330_09365 [Deltaproteobacteria bacterium]